MSELIDNRAQRISTLKDIIQHLHAGSAPDAVRSQLRQMVRQTDATEIMSMEQELIDGGMRVEEIRSMCDLHSQVTRDVLVNIPSSKALAPGHPVDTFRRENAALMSAINSGYEVTGRLADLQDDADASEYLIRLREIANELTEVDKHYQRKEHALFSCLERHGINGPAKVMWAKDDEVRGLVKAAVSALRESDKAAQVAKKAASVLTQAASAVKEMIFKEENILLPMALQTLSEEEWSEIWAASNKYGWCLVEPQNGYIPQGAKERTTMGLAEATITMPTGVVSVEQLSAVFSALPLDLTYVDADDRVAFFTEGPNRVFARSKAIIGRKVQNCHPPSSVGTVEQILSDFRTGKENVAEFWINFKGRFVHIRYFAVRGADQQYLGTVEVTQDVTGIRNLQGERRLLEYEQKETRSAS